MTKAWLNIVAELLKLTMVLTWLFYAMPMMAQDAAPGKPGDKVDHAPQYQLQARLAALEDDVDIEPLLKQVLLPLYKEALDELLADESYREQAQAFIDVVDSAPSKMREYDIPDEAPTYAENISDSGEETSTEQLQRELSLQRVYLSRLEDNLAKAGTELKRVEARPLAISLRLPVARNELKKLRSAPALLKQADYAASPELSAEHTLQQARESRLVSEIRMLEQEQLSQALREELLRGEQAFLARSIKNATAGLERIKGQLRLGLTLEAMRLKWLRQISLPLVDGDQPEAERALIEEVRGFAAEFERVVQNLDQAGRTRDQLAAHRKALGVDFSAIKEELELAGGGIGMTQVLLDLHRRLPEKRRDIKVLIETLPSVDDTRLASLRSKTALAEQAKVAQRFADHSLPLVALVVDARHDLLKELGKQYGHLRQVLAELQAEQARLFEALEQIDDYVSQQLFGFGSRDAPTFAVVSLAEFPNELHWYLQRAHWLEIGRAVTSTAHNPTLWPYAMLVFVGLLVWKRRWLWAAIERAGRDIRRFSGDRYSRTLEVLLWTLILAAPWPAAISYVNWALNQAPYLSQWAHGMTLGLYLTALITFTLRFLALMCRPEGLAEAHFGWRRSSLLKLRRTANQLLLAYLPALLLVYGGLYESGSDYLFNTGRVIFMLCHLLIAVIVWRLFNPDKGWLGELMCEQPERLVFRWRYLWIPLLAGTPVAVAILAATGYLITAIQTSRGLISMVTIVAIAAVGYGLAVRWLRIRQRRVAMARRLARADKEQRESAIEQELGIEVDMAAPDLGEISEQTLRLLRVLFTLAAVSCVLLYWSESVPLIGILETVSLPGFGHLSLADIFWVVLTMTLTYTLVRNLPGLMDLTILSNTKVQLGTRHAVVTLCQYALVIVGLSVMFKLLHMDWAMFGWIVAALGVGIGFGLQEIVANFVCGIILLFERPIRVGDRVTVDGVVGTVTHIHLRATIITNFDRQDFVVPNKRFITSSILNWTLSGELNRISVPVSVSPGIDMDSARQILFEAAMAHTKVLGDPAPIAVFESFSGGLRNFIVYAFLPELQHRLQIISELHIDIERRFAAAGIDIALPQTQLNLATDSSRGSSAGSWQKRE